MAGDPPSTGGDAAEDREEREDREDKVEAARRLLREAISRPPPVPVRIRSTPSPEGPADTGR